jgi:hypothetical protein
MVCYTKIINTQSSVDELITTFLNKGGRIDKYYLQSWNRNRHTILYLNGWFAGKNIREAILKALA